MALFQVTKVTAWTLVGSLFLGAAGVGVSTTRHQGAVNTAGVIASELVVAQAATEPEATVSGPSTKNSPKDGDELNIEGFDRKALNGFGSVILKRDVGASPNVGFAAAHGELSDFVSLGEFQPNKVGGFGGLLESPGITVTPVETTPQRTKIVVSGAFELNDENAKSLRATFKLKSGKEVSPDVWRSVVQGNGSQVVTLLLDSPVPAENIAQIKLHRLPNIGDEAAASHQKAIPASGKNEVHFIPGTIRSANHETKLVGINLGTADNVQPGDRINIYSQKPSESEIQRGVIRITRVISDRFSEAEIINEDSEHPIEVGDLSQQVKKSPSATAVAKPQISIRKSNPAEARILSKLNEATEISFVETTLRDALEYVEDLHNIDILILESEVTEDGGSIDQQVNLEMSNVTLESMLDRLLEPLGLDYVIEDEVMMVTSQTKAAERLELRVYPMKQLAAAWGTIKTDDPASTMKLTNLIMQAVAGKWSPDDPRGCTIGLTPAGLVVRQNQRTHREIENLIEQLRRAEEAK